MVLWYWSIWHVLGVYISILIIWPGNIDLFSKLCKTNLAPESFFIKDKDYSIISCSPENLIDRRGNFISTKPIAGTLKKNKKLNKSKALKYFRKNIKETKEHNMIVDMERNDLSRICVPGTVKIKKEKKIEEYKDLFHYVTLIVGRLRKNIKIIDIIKSMMPGGSVIGCPKISTLNLLNNQERENRNIYTGSFGFIKFNGDMRFNIIIRSLLHYKSISEISVASGVVVDSKAKNEFNENFIKAKALLDLFKWFILLIIKILSLLMLFINFLYLIKSNVMIIQKLKRKN